MSESNKELLNTLDRLISQANAARVFVQSMEAIQDHTKTPPVLKVRAWSSSNLGLRNGELLIGDFVIREKDRCPHCGEKDPERRCQCWNDE
jgi:hypothetical protein